MQGGARQVRDGGLQGVETIVQRQQSVLAEGDDDRLFRDREPVEWVLSAPSGDLVVSRFLHLATVFGLMPWRVARVLKLA